MNQDEARQARIEYANQKLTEMARDGATVDVGDTASALARAMIPDGMPVTPPDKYRAYIFKTIIYPALKSFGFDDRFRIDNLFANAAKGTKEAKQKWVMGEVEKLLCGAGAVVALVGARGVGKTTIAAQIAIKRLWEDWESGLDEKVPTTCRLTSYRKLNNIVSKLKGLYSDFGSIHIEEMTRHRDFLCGVIRNSTGGLDRWGVDLLVIDELNEASEDSKFKDRILADIVDRRYSLKLDTILLTNQKAEDFKTTTNTSILSRLNEHGKIIACEWDSFRDHHQHAEHPSI